MAGKWVKAARVADVAEGEVVGVRAGGEEIALYCLGGTYHATSNICTHEYAELSDGFVEGGVIECPLHAGRFDICSGKALGAPVSENLATYPVKVEGDHILVELPG
ncbi:MAG TPA: non-heme iron oxygenase ferredoxin subunit [Acetobacteraceae bacterium]|nr:non-heme iron oxygenase ferredoxin subunit [Acetobacteraceae bacterium]